MCLWKKIITFVLNKHTLKYLKMTSYNVCNLQAFRNIIFYVCIYVHVHVYVYICVSYMYMYICVCIYICVYVQKKHK